MGNAIQQEAEKAAKDVARSPRPGRTKNVRNGNQNSSSELKPRNTQNSRARNMMIHILLYGTGEAGKTTLLRQVARIFDRPLRENPEDIKNYIIDNVIRGCYNVIEAVETTLNIELPPGAQDNANAVQEAYNGFKKNSMFEPQTFMKLNAMLAQHIASLIQEQNFLEAVQQRSNYQLEDTWEYFAKMLVGYPDWGGPAWVPSEEDILKARIRTVGVAPREVTFEVGDATFKVTDVGGQRNERFRWMSRFGNIGCIVHVVAISEYDQKCFEDSTTNRLAEALDLWEKTVNMNQFSTTQFVLLFNKIDVFKWKYLDVRIPIIMEGFHFEDPPPQAEQDDERFSSARKWFEKLFLSKVNPAKLQDVAVDFTCALDRELTGKVIQEAIDHVIAAIESKKLDL